MLIMEGRSIKEPDVMLAQPASLSTAFPFPAISEKWRLVNFLPAIIQLSYRSKTQSHVSCREYLSSLVLIRNLLGKGQTGEM